MTNYDVIFDVFRDKAREYELYEVSEETSEDILRGWLKGAISKFKPTCASDLSDRDEDMKCFNIDLSEDEIDILAQCMVFMSLKPKMFNSDLFKNSLSTKDYSIHSPAKMLDSISDVYKRCEQETNSIINKYSFDLNDVSVLKR